MKNKNVEKKDANISLDIADDLYKIKDCNKIFKTCKSKNQSN